MAVREDIIEDLVWQSVQLADIRARPVIDKSQMDEKFENHMDFYIDSWLPRVTKLLKECVPVQIQVNGADNHDLFNTAYDFGDQLLGIEDAPSKHGYSVTEQIQLPYNPCLFYGFDQGSPSKVALLVSVSSSNDLFIDEIRRSPKVQLGKTPYVGVVSQMQVKLKPGEEPHPGVIYNQVGVYPCPLWFDAGREEAIIDHSDMTFGYFVACYGIMHMKHFTREERTASEKLNRVRKARGKEPIASVVEVKLSKQWRSQSGTGTHASPRPHWRRGHVRTLQSGKRVPVQPHMVMGDAPLPKELIVKK